VESTLRAGAGAPGLRLIETFALGTSHLALHRARMEGGAAALGWGFDGAGFDAACASAQADGGARVRLTLRAAGDFALEQAALAPTRPMWRLGMAAERLEAGDPWLAIKSSRRATYDRARTTLPEGLDEVIFLNQRGEVCDGTITTLFFDRGQGMRSPPLACGLLPGVLRRVLGAPEEVLLAEDLPRVRLWVGNSLRGLIPAIWT
jgi:4-amino-4-deoxychorismate lyase